MRLVIVTGMSGAGKTSALKMLEDMGFYCVDNLPIPLVEKFAQLTLSNQGGIMDAALGIDIRSGDELSALNRVRAGRRRPGAVLRGAAGLGLHRGPGLLLWGLPGAGGAAARFGGGRGVFGLFPVFIFDEKALLGGLLGGDCPVGGGGVVFL